MNVLKKKQENTFPSQYAKERQRYVQRDLESGETFERYIGNILSNLNYQTIYPNANMNVSSEEYDKDYSTVKIKLAKASDIQSKVSDIILLNIECSWRSIGYFLKKRTHTGIPLFKYENYIRNRDKKSLIIIGHGGKPSFPEKVFITNLNSFFQYGETIEYELFKHNKAKHSPHQRALNLKYFSISENLEDTKKILTEKIHKIINGKI